MSLLLLFRNDVGAPPPPDPPPITPVAPTVFFGSQNLAWGGNSNRTAAQARDAEIKRLLELTQQQQLAEQKALKPKARKVKLSGKNFNQQFQASPLKTQPIIDPLLIMPAMIEPEFDVDLMLYLFMQTF